jgi:molybdopterin-containing oxidoreductase family membrane subunit
MLFIFVDMGQPLRVLNVILHPSPNSVMFFDMLVLSVYLFLNILVGWTVLGAERKGIAAPSWVKPFIIISIAWAPSIHTVTAFLYAGLPGRHLWLTAIMAARFLASAFSGGPSLLILLALIVRKYTRFDAGQEAIQALGKNVTYYMITNV